MLALMPPVLGGNSGVTIRMDTMISLGQTAIAGWGHHARPSGIGIVEPRKVPANEANPNRDLNSI